MFIGMFSHQNLSQFLHCCEHTSVLISVTTLNFWTCNNLVKWWEGGTLFSCGIPIFFSGRPMDLRQVPSLSTQQLVAFALAILCELAKRLGIPLTVSADIGDPEVADEAGTTDPTVPSAASSHEAPSSTPAPTTPSGPRQGCCFLRPVHGCNNLCCKTSPHQQHVCSYHSWY